MLELIGIGLFVIILGFGIYRAINYERRIGRVSPFNGTSKN